jgi:hypothetical protein
VAGEKRVRKREPLMEFKKQETTEPDPDHPGVIEIKDAFGVPIHYDNTENGIFIAQDGSEHVDPGFREGHPPDPRDSIDLKAVKKEGIQAEGKYDLWSYGAGKHGQHEDLGSVIASWTVGRKKQETE